MEHHCRYCGEDSTAHSSPGVPMTHQIPLYAALSLFHSVARGRHTEGFQHFLFVEEKLLPGASLLWTVRGITRGITNVQVGRTSKNKKIQSHGRRRQCLESVAIQVKLASSVRDTHVRDLSIESKCY